MSKPKLTYFPFGGRAETIRLALFIGGIDFEDERIPPPEFGARKAAGAFPLGAIPVLEVNGTVYCQSMAILRYAGKLTGLYPTDPLEALAVDQILDTTAEIGALISPSIREQDADKKLALRKELVENADKLPKFLAGLNKLTGTGNYVAGDKLTIADLALVSSWNFLASGRLDGVDPAWVAAAAPNVAKLATAAKALPKIAEFFAKEAAAAPKAP